MPNGYPRYLHSSFRSYYFICAVFILSRLKHTPLNDINIICNIAHSAQMHLYGILACRCGKILGVKIIVAYKALVRRLYVKVCKALIYHLFGSPDELALSIGHKAHIKGIFGIIHTGIYLIRLLKGL